MSDLTSLPADSPPGLQALPDGRHRDFISLSEFISVCRKRLFVLAGIVLGFLLLCLLFNLLSPPKYEATARVALRMQPISSLTVEAAQPLAPASILSTPLQLETMVDIFRSERLAWRVITGLKLFQEPAFARNFGHRFPGFDPLQPTPKAQSYLLDRFAKSLKVHALPRTLLIQIDFQSKDPALSARVVNTLIREYSEQESESHQDATSRDTGWLEKQLQQLTTLVEKKEVHLADFERQHHFLSTQQSNQDGQRIDTLHDPSIQQVEETGRLLAAASGDRILREALYHQAQAGDPELVLAANPELQAEMGPGGATLLLQLHSRSSEMASELAELRAEHGPNYPRVQELERARADLAQQVAAEDANLREAFHRGWLSAGDREQLLRKQMDDRMSDGMRQNDALLEYAVLHEEVTSERALCTRMQNRIREARLASGVHASSITIVDPARIPFKTESPNWVLNFAITSVMAILVAFASVFWMENWSLSASRGGAVKRSASTVILLALLAGAVIGRSAGQAPTPSTSGLPAGVVRLPVDATPAHTAPDPREAPATWNSISASPVANTHADSLSPIESAPLASPITGGDVLSISEFHAPEFRSVVRVAEDGAVLLPLVGQLNLNGMTESQAARVVEKAFLDQGILLHPRVSVIVTAAVGQDVSVLGEVTRPGVYPFTTHHRLLDLISLAAGLSPNAGRLVTVVHRNDPNQAHAFVLDPSGQDSKADHNPQLLPGDTVLVSRAGLVYVIGDVVRPGGFAVDPVQGLTIVQALSLAWGATPNASVSKAILIRDQSGGRTLTTLNLRRMIRGQDPDQPVRDRDILFVPDSAAKNLLNRSLESAIQSAIGVSIYAGLVYSQRF